MVYYTSLPLIMQHSPDHHGGAASQGGCPGSVSPTTSAALQLGLSPPPHHHHQIINLSNNITLQAVGDQSQFGHHHPSLGHHESSPPPPVSSSALHSSVAKLGAAIAGIDYSMPRLSPPMLATVPPTKSKQTNFKCDQCNMCFGSKSAHTSHMKSHIKQQSQQYQQPSPPAGQGALDLANGQMPRPNDQYQCDVCKKTFAVPARLVSFNRWLSQKI